MIAMLKVEGMSLEEVARATSSSVGSVKQKVHRAYKKLRETIGAGPGKWRREDSLERKRDSRRSEKGRAGSAGSRSACARAHRRLDQAASRPVLPLPPVWLMAVNLVVVCAAVSLAGAARTGFVGFAKMNLLERSLVFPALVLLLFLAAVSFVHQMIPASRLRISPRCAPGFSTVGLLAVFAPLFCDYQTDHFFRPASHVCSPVFSMQSPPDC